MPRMRRDALGRRIKASRSIIAQRQGRSTPKRRRSGTLVDSPARRTRLRRVRLDELVATARSQDEIERAARLDAVAAAGLVSCARAHEAWAYYWAKVLGAPPEEEWHGREGAVATIRRVFVEPKGSTRSILRVLKDAEGCMRDEQQYSSGVNRPARSAAKLSLDGPEACIIADLIEDGMTLQQTTEEVNAFRIARGLQHVGKNAVRTCMYALDPIDEDVLDRAQGKSDPTSAWARARYNWVTYLLVRFGQLSQEQLEKQFPGGVVPDWRTLQRSSAASAPLVRRPATLPLRYSLAARLDAPPKGVAAYSRHRCRGARLAGWLPTAQF